MMICCTCTPLPNACIGWILCTTALWGLSQAAKLSLTIAPYMQEFSGLHWPCVDSLTGTYLFINPSLVCFSLTFVGISHSKLVIIVCTQMTPSYCPSLRFRLNLANRHKDLFAKFTAPAAWNHLQTDLQLILIKAFKNVVKGLEANSVGICNFFLS